MRLCDNSRLPIGTGESFMFLKITKLQLKLYEEELINTLGKCNTIIEFCATPIFCKGFRLTKKDKKELEHIINKLQTISRKLNEIKEEIQSL